MKSRRILYILLLTAAMALSIMYRCNPTVILFMGIIIAGIADAFVFFICSRKIRAGFYIENKQRVVGDIIEFFLKIENPTILFINYLIVNVKVKNCFEDKNYKMKLKGAIKSLGTTIISQKIKSSHTGKIIISSNDSKIYSFLGLFKKKLKVEYDGYVFIFPEKYEDTSYFEPDWDADDNDDVKYRTDIAGNDKTEVFDIREYREGDDIRSIHWKLTGKKDVMMVKTFSEPLKNQMLIFANYALTEDVKALKGEEWLCLMDNYIKKLMSILLDYSKGENAPIFAFYGNKGIYSYRIDNKKDVFDAIKVLMSNKMTDETCLLKGVISNYPEMFFKNIKYISFPVSENEKNQIEGGMDDRKIDFIICK